MATVELQWNTRVEDTYSVRNVVHNDGRSSTPVIHRGKAVVSFLPSRVPYLKLHRRLVDC
jgi:hypothetical protein